MLPFISFHGAGRAPLDHMQKKYDEIESYPYYKELKAQGTKVIGTWDDHDYGINDGGMDYADKKETRKMFLDMIEEPIDSPRRLDSDSPIH